MLNSKHLLTIICRQLIDTGSWYARVPLLGDRTASERKQKCVYQLVDNHQHHDPIKHSLVGLIEAGHPDVRGEKRHLESEDREAVQWPADILYSTERYSIDQWKIDRGQTKAPSCFYALMSTFA